jgi:hypothetical protein
MEVGRPGANPELIQKYAAELRELFIENTNSSNVRQDLAKMMKIKILSDEDRELSPMGS